MMTPLSTTEQTLDEELRASGLLLGLLVLVVALGTGLGLLAGLAT